VQLLPQPGVPLLAPSQSDAQFDARICARQFLPSISIQILTLKILNCPQESRTKTTYSLMAAGVRELKERQPQYQYVVKTLASYGELLTLRNRMARTSLSKQPLREDAALSQKDVFFVDAFRKTYQLLFRWGWAWGKLIKY